MPTITLSKKELEKHIGKMPVEKLKDRISMFGTDLEKIEDDSIIVEIFPNRPDLLSEQGFARAFSTFIGKTSGLKQYKASAPSKDYKVIIDKSVEKVRPHTMCAIIKNIKFDEDKIREIIQMQEKLHTTYCRNRKKAAIGIYPLDKINLPITYTAKPPRDIKFVPLEMDKELDALKILSQHPAGRDYTHLLEGKKLYPIFIDAAGQILSMPPIINSHHTGKVDTSTKDVFIECSGFDEKVLSKLLNMIVCTFADMGGEICSMYITYPKKKKTSPELEPESWPLDLKYINRLLGLDLDKKGATHLLEKMGFSLKGDRIQVPCYRADIMHQCDFAEDMAIAYGFENFTPEIPKVSTIGHEAPIEIFKRKISQILLGLGLIEVNSYHITNKDTQAKKMLATDKQIELANALTSEYDVLRSWITPNHLEILERNKSYEYPQNIFEINTIFKNNPKTETGIEENLRLCVTLCSKEVDFTKIKQVLDYLFDNLDETYTSEETDHPSFIPGRVARISFKNKKIAYIGEMHPKVLENFSLTNPVAVFELNITELYEEIDRKNN